MFHVIALQVFWCVPVEMYGPLRRLDRSCRDRLPSIHPGFGKALQILAVLSAALSSMRTGGKRDLDLRVPVRGLHLLASVHGQGSDVSFLVGLYAHIIEDIAIECRMFMVRCDAVHLVHLLCGRYATVLPRIVRSCSRALYQAHRLAWSFGTGPGYELFVDVFERYIGYDSEVEVDTQESLVPMFLLQAVYAVLGEDHRWLWIGAVPKKNRFTLEMFSRIWQPPDIDVVAEFERVFRVLWPYVAFPSLALLCYFLCFVMSFHVA